MSDVLHQMRLLGAENIRQHQGQRNWSLRVRGDGHIVRNAQYFSERGGVQREVAVLGHLCGHPF